MAEWMILKVCLGEMNQLTIANVNSLFWLFILNDRYILLEQFPAYSSGIFIYFDLLQPGTKTTQSCDD